MTYIYVIHVYVPTSSGSTQDWSDPTPAARCETHGALKRSSGGSEVQKQWRSPLMNKFCIWLLCVKWQLSTPVLHRAFIEQEIQPTNTEVAPAVSNIISTALNQLLGTVAITGSAP